MIFYRTFTKHVNGVLTRQDPVAYTAVVKNASGTTVETPTPAKDTTFYPDGHYKVTLTDSLYDAPSQYEIEGTYEMVAGHSQTFSEWFTPLDDSSATGAQVYFGMARNDPHGETR